MVMTDPVTVTISHRLGRDGAKRRIAEGLDKIRADVAPYVAKLDSRWEGEYRVSFTASAMMQTITGRIDVEEDVVRVELALPGLLNVVARTIAGRIEHRATALLEPPKSKV